jgi:hypothetical protein
MNNPDRAPEKSLYLRAHEQLDALSLRSATAMIGAVGMLASGTVLGGNMALEANKITILSDNFDYYSGLLFVAFTGVTALASTYDYLKKPIPECLHPSHNLSISEME